MAKEEVKVSEITAENIDTVLKQDATVTKEIAEEGDVVLLSPSTSSFDEFHSYVERGNVFKDIVNKL